MQVFIRLTLSATMELQISHKFGDAYRGKNRGCQSFRRKRWWRDMENKSWNRLSFVPPCLQFKMVSTVYIVLGLVRFFFRNLILKWKSKGGHIGRWGGRRACWWLLSLSVHSPPLCTVNARLLSGSHVHHIHDLSSWYKEIVKCKSCLVFFYIVVCVFCVSLAIFSVFCIGLAIFCSNPLQKPGIHCFFVCCQESTVPCPSLPFSVYSTIFCLLSGVLEFVLFGVDPLLSGVCYFPKSTLFFQGFAVAFYLEDCFPSAVRSLISVLCWVSCLLSTMFCLMKGGGGPTLCVRRGDEHWCKFVMCCYSCRNRSSFTQIS